jgi:hypothetical protein
MLYFFLNIPDDEIVKLQNHLPKGSFCLFQVQVGSSRYYGVIKNDAFPELQRNLTPETTRHLEKLDKNVFRMFFLQNIGDSIACIGNRTLLVHLSDED